jgi:hypothetical protein
MPLSYISISSNLAAKELCETIEFFEKMLCYPERQEAPIRILTDIDYLECPA